MSAYLDSGFGHEIWCVLPICDLAQKAQRRATNSEGDPARKLGALPIISGARNHVSLSGSTFLRVLGTLCASLLS